MDFRHLLKHNRLTLAPVSERGGERPGSLAPVFTGDFYQPLAAHLWNLHAGFTHHLYFLTGSAFAKLLFVWSRKFARTVNSVRAILLIPEGPIFFSHTATLKTR